MKKTLIVIVMLCMVFILGCTSDAINPTAEQTDSPTSPTINAETLLPTVNLGDEFTPTPSVRFCDEPDEYLRLEGLLRSLGFGDDERLELYPSRLKNGLWRASFYDKPIETARVLLCVTDEMDYPEIQIPGGEFRVGHNAIKVKFADINPEYDLADNKDVPYYLVDKEATKMVYSDVTIIMLNGFGITDFSYPILTPRLPGALNNYVKYDYERKVEGEEETYEAHSLYEIYYCENEIVWIEQIRDIGIRGTDWEYKK